MVVLQNNHDLMIWPWINKEQLSHSLWLVLRKHSQFSHTVFCNCLFCCSLFSFLYNANRFYFAINYLPLFALPWQECILLLYSFVKYNIFMGSSYTPTLNKRHDFFLSFAQCKPDFFLAVSRGNLSPLHFLGKNASSSPYSFVKYNIFLWVALIPRRQTSVMIFFSGFAQCKPEFFLATIADIYHHYTWLVKLNFSLQVPL